MGAGIAASPHCAERRICRCSIYLGSRSRKSSTPLLDPGSPAQASLPIVQLPLARSPADLLDYVARRLAGLSTGPAWFLSIFDPETETSGAQNRPMFRGPSWDNLYRVSLRSPDSTRKPRSRVAQQGDHLFRRLFPTGPDQNPKVPFIACRRRSVLLSPAASFLPLRAFRGGGDFRPDHLSTMHLAPESRKRNFW